MIVTARIDSDSDIIELTFDDGVIKNVTKEQFAILVFEGFKLEKK